MITSPTLLVDQEKVIRNIKRMQAKAEKSQAEFRPHFKTHQAAVIGEWFRPLGIEKIAASSLEMAAYFAAHNWFDITVAFPLNPLEFAAVNRLASSITLNITISAMEAAQHLCAAKVNSVGCFIEVDTGYGRTGIDAADFDSVQRIIELLAASPHQFKGFLAHAGDAYKAKGRDEIYAIYDNNIKLLAKLRERFASDADELTISYGDTPSCSIVERLEVVNELRPGNFVFYDITQMELGACELDDIAVAVACPVVAVSEKRKEVIVHGGAVHLSKDYLERDDGQKSFGEVVALDSTGWRVDQALGYVSGISQEHGIIKATDEFLATAKIGELVAVLPIHSCLIADNMNRFTDLEGNVIIQRPKNIFSGPGATEYGAGNIKFDDLP